MSNIYVGDSNIAGRGIFTTTRIRKHKRVAYIDGEVVSFPELRSAAHQVDLPENWIGVGRYTWINTNNSLFRYINHSCDPNVAIVGKRTVIAIKDIAANTEIVMDYSLTEAEEGWQMRRPCRCGSKQCRKIVRSISTLPRSVIAQHKSHIPRNFLKIYKLDNAASC